VAGATVKVQDPATGWTRTVQSNGEGLYGLPLIPPGNYQITVTQAGFQAAVSPVRKLDVNQISTQDFHLQVGSQSQTVDVMAAAELLQASSTELGTVVEQRAVSDLPLNGRSFTTLLTLAPGAEYPFLLLHGEHPIVRRSPSPSRRLSTSSLGRETCRNP
jgi:Carboxypeptidase regulatory-like domain